MKMSPKIQREDGAAAVEFAIIAPLLFMLIFGMLQFGLAFWQVQNLRSAAREGARVAAVRGSESDVYAAMGAATDSLPVVSGTPSGWSIAGYTACTDATSGDPVTIQIATFPSAVTSSFQLSIPFVPLPPLTPTISGSFRCE